MNKLITLIFFFITFVASAQDAINYKAIVKDGGGTILANQNVDVRFSILEGVAQTNVYTEDHNTTADANGLIILNIGIGTFSGGAGTYSSVDWSSDDHFLRVQMDIGAGYIDVGTTQFMAVPYALQAEKAANVTGIEALDEGNGTGWRLKGKLANSYGNIGANAVDLSNSTSTSSTRGARGSNSFAAGQNTVASGNMSAAFGYENQATGFSATALGYRTIAGAVGNVAVGSYNIGGGVAGNFDPENPVFEVGNGLSGGARSNALTVLQNGKVGIGKNTGMDGILEIVGNSTGTVPHLALIENQADFSRFRFKNTNRNGDDYWDISGFIGTSLASDRLNIFNNGIGDIISVTGDGKVGIGSYNPTEKLDVNGAIKADEIQLTIGAANGFVLTSNASGDASWQAPSGGTGGGPDNDWIVTGSSMYPFDSNLNVGIGTNNPTEKLQVLGKIKAQSIQLATGGVIDYVLTSDGDGNATWQPAAATENGWNVVNNGTNVVSTVSGNVGIGTNNPFAKLTVEGNVDVKGGIYSISGASGISKGVEGFSVNGTGVKGSSTNSLGVVGVGEIAGGQFTSTNGKGLIANTQASGKAAVDATAIGNHGLGVHARSTAITGSGIGVYGESDSPNGSGVRGDSANTGVYGSSRVSATNGVGVLGASLRNTGTGIGVNGRSASASGYDFYADGAGTDYGAASSIRWKRNIVEIDSPLEKLSKIRGVYYDWDEAHGGNRDLGMIAEEVGAVLPEIVNYEPNGIDAIGMDYGKMTPLLVQVAKEQQKIIHAQSAKVVQLEQQLRELTMRMDQMVAKNTEKTSSN